MLQIHNLHATVADKPILKGLSPTLNADEIHAIMGPNGAGKSTLTYSLAISLGLTTLSACGTAPAQSEDCALLGQQRVHDIEAVMKEAKAINPDLKPTDKGEYPSLKDSEKYLMAQAQIDQIEANFHAKCPERK